MAYYFAKSTDGKKVHVTTTSEGSRTYGLCNGMGGYYSHVRILNEDDEDWPEAMDDVCANCRKQEGVEGFLVEKGLMETPEAVLACVHVDIKIPKKKITLSEARSIISKIDNEIKRFEDIDSTGFCVKFNVRTY